VPHYPANNNTKWYLHNENENVKEMKFHRLDLRYPYNIILTTNIDICVDDPIATPKEMSCKE